MRKALRVPAAVNAPLAEPKPTAVPADPPNTPKSAAGSDSEPKPAATPTPAAAKRRAHARAAAPATAPSPDVGSDPAFYPSILEAHNYFQTLNLSAEDLQRAEAYAANVVRAAAGAHFADYGEYLDSLGMTAEISSFRPVYMERIAQLINKSNQFNLTTRRYTLAEVEATAAATRSTEWLNS